MLLFWLLLLPILLGVAGLLFSKGRVTWKECLVHEGVVIMIIAIGYFIAIRARTADTEIWNGVVASKDRGTQGCCHSYPCNPHPCNCDDKGNCSTCWDTCYEHSWDRTWYAYSSNGETIYSVGCGRPGQSDPGRWTDIRIGEPTAVEHSYENYIKGNPDSVIRRQGVAERFGKTLPAYPKVYDYYRANRFIAVGVSVPELRALNARLSEINARLGAKKKLNIVVVVVRQADQSYLEGLREHWIGGKKNDLVVVIGAPDFPAIAWAGVISWTKSEDLKVDLRNRLLDLKDFDGGKVLDIVEEEAAAKFVHRSMSDFEYLKATVEPSSGVTWFLFILGLVLGIGLQIFFWIHDPFDDGHGSSWPRFRKNRL
jgi:hypothetical protein